MLKKYILGLTVVLMALFIVACGNEKDNEETEKAPDENGAVEISKEEKVPEEEVVAVINGNDVTGKTYNLVYAQLKLHAGQIGQEVDTNEVKVAAMESVIDRELLMQQAKEEGIEVTNEAAESEFENLKKENKEGLNTILEQFAMTEETFKEQLKFELTLNKYKEQAFNISVSDEEIKEYYEKAKEGNDEIPALEEIKPQLKDQLEMQKSDEELQKKIDEIRKSAKIEKKMEA